MNKYLVNNSSDKLLLFFTGWGCDEYEFEHLKSDCDVLILFDYFDLSLDFDFSKYKEINLITFSAGVFVASVMSFDFKINKKIAIGGNPYLFDEYYGLSKEILNVFDNITEENADDFAKNYLVKTDEEWKNFHNSKRTLESCRSELENLERIYADKEHEIKDIYDVVLLGAEDKIFNISAQKEFYGNKVKIIENARHNLFFRINNYEEIFNMK